jgi:hypothetical protein
VVEDGQMPPWYAHPRFGEFKNARVMSAEEKQILSDWIQTGKAPGDLASAPPPPPFPDSQWQIGEPDLLVRAMKEEEIPATGYIPYRYIAFPHVFTHDTWIQGIQIQPSNPRVVHHANLAYVTLGKGFDVREGFLTGRVPGGIPVQLDPGVAMLIPKGAMLAVQAHYVTTGKPEKDRISVGFRYARGTIHKRVRYKILANYSFAIPPGVSAHPVLASDTLECDATGLGLFQHMHLRGKDTTFLAHYPNGRSEVVLAIPNYSFDWQIAYVWKDGYQKFPKGTRLENRSHFDNSRFNPFNPDPLATVRDGPQTHHEMMQGYFFYTDDAEHLSIQVDPKTGREILSRSQAAAD